MYRKYAPEEAVFFKMSDMEIDENTVHLFSWFDKFLHEAVYRDQALMKLVVS